MASIHEAARNGDDDAIKLSVSFFNKFYSNELCTLLNEKDPDGNSPLHLAAAGGYLNTITYLLNNGAVYYTKNNHGRTPLHYAAGNNCKDVAIYLIEHVQNKNPDELKDYIDVKDNIGITSLHWAATNGHLEIVKYLLDTGADYDTKNKNNRTPLHYAAKNGHDDVVSSLVKYVRHNNPTILKKYIDENSEKTPLHYAAEYGHLNIVKYLLNNGADFNAKNNEHWTPLHFASKWGYKDVIISLITHIRNNKSDVLEHYINAKTKKGNTALYYASGQKHDEIMTILSDNGAL